MLTTRVPVLFAAAWLLAVAAAPAQDSSRRDAPGEEALEDYEVVTIVYPADAQFPGWKLAHKLSYDATEGAATIKRFHWKDLANAFNSVPLTPPDKVEHRKVGDHDLLVAKREGEAGQIEATLYIPKGLLQPQSGRYELTFNTAFSRSRVTHQEITTWPLRFEVGYADEVRENRTVEGNGFYERILIRERNRPELRDEEGNVIPFHEVEPETVQDSRAAGVDLGYYWLVRPTSRLGRIDAGLTAGGAWEQDEINLVDRILRYYLGLNLKLTSVTVDDLTLKAGLRFGGTEERYIIYEEVIAEDGTLVADRAIEEISLPTWQVVLSGTAPLYRLNHVTMILFKAEGTWLQSFEKSGAESGLPEKTQRVRTLAVGITFQTPIGAALAIHGRIESYDLPGVAGERIEDLQWSSGFTASMTLAF